MRSTCDSSEKTDISEGTGFGSSGRSELKDVPGWKIVEAGSSGSFSKDFAAPVLTALVKLVTKELHVMETQINKEKNHGR